jgi:hypothetical protein
MFRIWFSVYLTRKDVLTRSTSPLRSGPMETMSFIIIKSNKVKKTPFQKEIQKLKDRIEQEKDEDIKRGLGKEYIVQVIQNGLNLLD